MLIVFLFNSIDAQENMTLPSEKSDREWNTSSRYIRPRIFCLEHTIELQRLLRSRGGLKFLVICHKGKYASFAIKVYVNVIFCTNLLIVDRSAVYWNLLQTFKNLRHMRL